MASTIASTDYYFPSTEEPGHPEVIGVDDNAIEFDPMMLIIAVGCLGFISNSLSLLLMCYQKKLRMRQGMLLIINQCALDATSSVFVAAFHAFKLHYGRRIAPAGGFAGQLFCRFYSPVLHWGFMASSSYNLLAITTERYLMIVYPLIHKTTISPVKLYCVIIMVWFIGPTYRLIFGTPTNELRDGRKCVRNWPSQEFADAFGTLTPIFEFFLPAFLMTIMYVRMIWKLRNRIKKNQVAPVSQTTTVNRSHRNLIKTLVVVVVCFLCCWMINETYFFLKTTGLKIEINDKLHHASIVLVYINCSINPFIYLFKFKEFRKAARKLVECGRFAGDANGSSSTGVATGRST